MERESLIQWLERLYATTETEIDCEQLQALLPAFVDFELAGGEMDERFSRIRAHLAQCPDCSEEYELLRKVAKLEAQGLLQADSQSLTYETNLRVDSELTPAFLQERLGPYLIALADLQQIIDDLRNKPSSPISIRRMASEKEEAPTMTLKDKIAA